jgi:hypothetical protein
MSSYVRTYGADKYLVVMNADPVNAHEVTLHFTARDNLDSHGILQALGVANNQERFFFEEVFARKTWIPQDPAIGGQGTPGWTLYRAGNVPSGLYLGVLPAGSTFVFKVRKI